MTDPKAEPAITGIDLVRRAFPAMTAASLRAAGFTGLIAGAAAVIMLLALLRDAPLVAPVPVPWWAIAVLFFLAEAAVIRMRIGRSAPSISMSDIPVVLGIFFLAPIPFVLTRLLGQGLALVVVRRQSALKAAFNLAQFSLSSVVALWIVHLLDHPGRTLAPADWGAAFAATFAENLIGVLAIATVVSLADGRAQFRQVPTMLTTASIVALTNTSFALLAITVLYTRPLAAMLFVVPLLAALLAHRAYISEKEQHQSLEMLYESTRILQRSPVLDRAILDLLSHARKMFRAEIAELSLLPASDGNDVLRTSVGPADEQRVMVPLGPALDDPDLLRCITERRAMILPTLRGGERQTTRRFGCELIAPLVGETRLIGTLVVADRSTDGSAFDSDDLRLLEAVANLAAVALENGRLEQSLDQLSRLKEELHHQAYHDALTGLANRSLFAQAVAVRLESPDPSGRVPTVLFLDLDDFKDVNDSMGHAAGDVLLAAVGDRIRSCLREGDLAARLGGDEFGVLLWDRPDLTATHRVAGRLSAAFGEPYFLDGASLVVQASIGVAVGRAGSGTADELLRHADVAMYSAKASGKGRTVYFEPQMGRAVVARQELTASLQRAVAAGEFTIHYQPVVEATSGRLTAAEALLRWNHPKRGLLPAGVFVSRVEESDLVCAVGRFVLADACRRLRDWTARWPQVRDLRINVNVGARHLEQPSFVEEVLETIGDVGVSPESIVLEMTEATLLADVDDTVRKLQRLRDAGLGVSIDDFGTGYSSLSYLQHFPVTQLKIAAPFVQVDENDPDAWALAAAIVALGRALRLEIIAEGVESLSQLKRLQELGCQYVQGFYLARPLDAPGFEELLARRSDLSLGPAHAFGPPARPRLVAVGAVEPAFRPDRAEDSAVASVRLRPQRRVQQGATRFRGGTGASAGSA